MEQELQWIQFNIDVHDWMIIVQIFTDHNQWFCMNSRLVWCLQLRRFGKGSRFTVDQMYSSKHFTKNEKNEVFWMECQPSFLSIQISSSNYFEIESHSTHRHKILTQFDFSVKMRLSTLYWWVHAVLNDKQIWWNTFNFYQRKEHMFRQGILHK